MKSTTPHPAVGLRGLLKEVALGLVSLLVLAIAVLYVVAPSAPDMSLRAGEITGDEPYDYVATAAYSYAGSSAPVMSTPAAWSPAATSTGEVIYGSVTAQGVKVASAELVLRRVDEHAKPLQATVKLRSSGAYRVAVNLPTGNYLLTVHIRIGANDHAVSKRVALRKGRHYSVSVVVRSKGIVSLLPVGSY